MISTARVESRLPSVGTNIFTVMSTLAAECGAINLGQGFPDFDCAPELVEAVNAAMRAGRNQYAPMAGVPELREAVAIKIEQLYGCRYDPVSEITVTAGASQAIYTAIQAIVHPGDEVILLEPCYDSYAPSVAMASGRAIRVPLSADTYRPDFDRISEAIGPRTRAIVINTPHNPTATCWSSAEVQQLSDVLAPTNVMVISDEVYEHIVFDGRLHASVSSIRGLAERSFVISSFGKTYHITGWKIGTVAAPRALMEEFRKVHQFDVFTVNTPTQHALSTYMRDKLRYLELPAFYQAKRDLFRAGLAGSRFELLPAAGSYFQCAKYSAISDLPDEAFCRWLIAEAGVAAIPLSAFQDDRALNPRVVRFCFAKKPDTLLAAVQRLERL